MRFHLNDPDEAATGLMMAVGALRRGELVAFPTETVYGLGADAGNGRAVAAIFAAKGRPRFNPLIIHCESVGAAGRLGRLEGPAARLAAVFWPGPLTLVVPKVPGAPVSELATAGLESVALRVPAHPAARRLLERFGGPVAAPSANLSGHVSPTRAEHVIADLGNKVAVVLDGGPTEVGLESSIIAVEGDKATLLRPGGVPVAAIEAALGAPVERGTMAAGDAPAAPGMLPSHYAPAAALRLGAADVRPGEALLAFGSTPVVGSERAVATLNLSPAGDLADAAANLFAALRSLDAQGRTIAVAPIPEDGLGEAINDRLRRAAAPRTA